MSRLRPGHTRVSDRFFPPTSITAGSPAPVPAPGSGFASLTHPSAGSKYFPVKRALTCARVRTAHIHKHALAIFVLVRECLP